MTDTPRMIAGGFDGFMAAVGLSDVGEGQRREMKRTFFAGARFYSSFLDEHASHEDELTDADIALCEALEVEMEAFAQDVLEGRA
jgi:hypothetical protein